jgi:hypothetical protein
MNRYDIILEKSPEIVPGTIQNSEIQNQVICGIATIEIQIPFKYITEFDAHILNTILTQKRIQKRIKFIGLNIRNIILMLLLMKYAVYMVMNKYF